MEEWTNRRVPEAEPGGTYCAHNHAPGLVTAPTVHTATTLSFIVKWRFTLPPTAASAYSCSERTAPRSNLPKDPHHGLLHSQAAASVFVADPIRRKTLAAARSLIAPSSSPRRVLQWPALPIPPYEMSLAARALLRR